MTLHVNRKQNRYRDNIRHQCLFRRNLKGNKKIWRSR